MEIRRLNWTGHLLRMNASKLPIKAFEFKLNIKNARGRPRKTWLDSTKTILAESGISWPEAKELTQNRSEWKKKINEIVL